MNPPPILLPEKPDSPPAARSRRASAFLGDGILLSVTVLLYAKTLGRGFVSEDFVILRRLHGYGAADVVREFAGPWLGSLDFYRPLSTLILRVALGAFGLNALAFDVFHLTLHAACALLVSRIARGRLGGLAGFAAGLLFALFPLHPNTVSFLASFATLYSTFFALIALRCLDTGQDRRGVLAMAAALWSYEGAVAAAVAAAFWVLLATPRSWLEPRRRRVSASLALLVAAFLLIRAGALGVSIGGYAGFRERFSIHSIGLLPGDLLFDLRLLLIPEALGPMAPPLLGLVLLGVLTSLGMGRRAGTGDRKDATGRTALLALAGLLLALAPFAFVRIIPALGRYAYLASFWSSVLVAGLLFGSWSRDTRRPLRAIRVTAFLILVACQAVALASALDRHREASVLAGKVSKAIEAAAWGLPKGEDLFVTSAPDFLRDAHGRAIAQVHHWGLADRFLPPFRSEAVSVVSAADLPSEELAPLIEAGAAVFRYEPDSARLTRVENPSPHEARITINGPQGDIPADQPLRIRWTPKPGLRYRGFVLCRALSQVLDGNASPGEVSIPASVLRQVAGLYDGRIWYWVGARDDSGVLTLSALRSVRVVFPED